MYFTEETVVPRSRRRCVRGEHSLTFCSEVPFRRNSCRPRYNVKHAVPGQYFDKSNMLTASQPAEPTARGYLRWFAGKVTCNLSTVQKRARRLPLRSRTSAKSGVCRFPRAPATVRLLFAPLQGGCPNWYFLCLHQLDDGHGEKGRTVALSSARGCLNTILATKKVSFGFLSTRYHSDSLTPAPRSREVVRPYALLSY